jgi:hypothetical protein
MRQKAVITQAGAGFGCVWSCGEGEVVHAGDGLDGVGLSWTRRNAVLLQAIRLPRPMVAALIEIFYPEALEVTRIFQCR